MSPPRNARKTSPKRPARRKFRKPERTPSAESVSAWRPRQPKPHRRADLPSHLRELHEAIAGGMRDHVHHQRELRRASAGSAHGPAMHSGIGNVMGVGFGPSVPRHGVIPKHGAAPGSDVVTIYVAEPMTP